MLVFTTGSKAPSATTTQPEIFGASTVSGMRESPALMPLPVTAWDVSVSVTVCLLALGA